MALAVAQGAVYVVAESFANPQDRPPAKAFRERYSRSSDDKSFGRRLSAKVPA